MTVTPEVVAVVTAKVTASYRQLPPDVNARCWTFQELNLLFLKEKQSVNGLYWML
jgi:hypothetical protein